MPSPKILVAFTTNAGTTADVAQMIGEELNRDGVQVEVRRLEEVTSIASYTAVVVGGPMILGWHKAAMRFVKKYQQALSQIPVAYFFTAMRLTDTGGSLVGAIQVNLDPILAKPPKNPPRLSFTERYATVENYLRPALRAARSVNPVSVGFFGGRLELFRLKWWQSLFVLLIIQAQPGGSHNGPFIREWASSLRLILLASNQRK